MAVPPINFDSNEAKAYVALAVGVLGLAYLWLRPMLKKKRGDPLEKAPFASLSQNRAVEREMQNLLVELSQMSRQITAQLDTRAEKLNVLIEDADRRIAELKGLVAAPASGDREAESGVRGLESGVGSQGLGVARSESTMLTPGACLITPDSDDPRHAEIYVLADAGLPPLEISRRLGRPRGEIELILALRGTATSRRAVG